MAVEGTHAGPTPLLLVMVFSLLKFTGALYLFAAPEPPEDEPATEAGERFPTIREKLEAGLTGLAVVMPTGPRRLLVTTQRRTPPPAGPAPLVRLRLADSFEVVDDVQAELPDPATAFAVSDPVFAAAHRVAWDVRAAGLEWTLSVDLAGASGPEAWYWSDSNPVHRERLDARRLGEPESAAVCLARHAQQAVSETLGPWPPCSDHGHRADPSTVDGAAVWSCPSNRRVIASIGRIHELRTDA